MQRVPRLLFIAVTTAVVPLSPPAAAFASEGLSDPNVSAVTLTVNRKGEALVSYVRQDGRPRHVLAWGAVNARPPVDPAVPQVRFRYDYAGGWGKYRNPRYWRSFRDFCAPYDGPPLTNLVAACLAPDGSYWALQSWRRRLPLLGFAPWKPEHMWRELHLSHWTGELPKLEVFAHWTYGGRWQGVFGRLTYLGAPVHGFASTGQGNPKERYGRNVYIDTLDSAYGPGWKRESGILTHRPTGTFCHSFVPQRPHPGYPSTAMRPAAPGRRYRVTVMGPGVTPIVRWEGPGLTPADRASSSSVKAIFDQLMAGDAICAPER